MPARRRVVFLAKCRAVIMRCLFPVLCAVSSKSRLVRVSPSPLRDLLA
jgi:hypothetical protein